MSPILYSSRRPNKNSELSYEAELSCLSKSSISLPREKKKSAIFGSQQTTTLDRSLVSVKWRHRLPTQLVSVLSFSTRVFFFFQLDSHFFFRLKFQNFDSFFFRSWTYILQISSHIFYCIRCILQVSTKVLCFQNVFTIRIICPQRNAIPKSLSFKKRPSNCKATLTFTWEGKLFQKCCADNIKGFRIFRCTCNRILRLCFSS